MTTPGNVGPEYEYVVGPGNTYGRDYDEATIRAITRGNIGGYENAQGGFQGVISDLAGIAEQTRDEQLDLIERVDLLDGVEGYCAAFMSKNWTLNGGAMRTLPFDTQLGPNKNVTLETDGLRLGTRGLWRADAHVTFYPRPAGWLNSNAGFSVFLQVLDIEKSYEVFTQAQYDLVIGPYGNATASFPHTFVIPSDNRFKVIVRVQHTQSSHRVFGGTLRSSLSVNKWDNGTDNAIVAPVVPDGGTLG